jgi:hypothetical protein
VQRLPVECIVCHEKDYDRTALLRLSHPKWGFSINCRECHNVIRFAPSTFPDHEACLPINGGPHANIGCFDCHQTGFPAVSTDGICGTGTATCMTCHSHSDRVALEAQHPKTNPRAAGFQPVDASCINCHRGGLVER